MAGEVKEWNRLPYHILVSICSYLRVHDRNRFARVCKDFSEIIDCKHIWRRFKFCLTSTAKIQFKTCLEKYGKYMHYVDIELDQADTQNRENALWVLAGFHCMKEHHIKHLGIRFKGENPCFYSGREFIDALEKLLGPIPTDHIQVYPLVDLDLGELSVSLSGKFLDVISANNPHLQRLNIQNSKVLICNIAPDAVLRLAERCRHLRDLHVFSQSLTDEVLLCFAEQDRAPLEHLSIMYRRHGISTKIISSETWRALTDRSPKLHVSLLFDHTCPTESVAEVMKPEIPVSKLAMETYTYIYDEVNQASRWYARTLEKFILHTPISRNAPELNAALIQLAAECELLKEMHVYCVLDSATIDKILELRPKLKEHGKYTLRPELWVLGSVAPVTGYSDVC